MKKIIRTLGIAILGGAIALAGYKTLIEKPQVIVEKAVEPTMQTVKASYTPTVINSTSTPTDFTEAAGKTVHAVVHVKNTSIRTQQNPLAELFYGRGSGTRKFEQIGTGSGVIISPDGYIVTNNHVIEGASDIEITLNNQKKLKATLIGADKSNDIALLKVEADFELPNIPFGNSDNIKVGEWVLAVGNPYNLTSTVTAGIVSAKGRDLDGNTNIDSFIQTDAAVNPGNSGGALVNTRGELIGINTAISSRTGSFIGYSFAVPSNIAKKVVDDLLEFGTVQEALIGISYDDTEDGVEVTTVTENGGAEKAGIKKGDIITKINNVKISKFSDLKGQLTARRPGDKVIVTVVRDGNELEKLVVLSKKDFVSVGSLGIIIKDLSKSDLKKNKLNSGAKITENVNPFLKRLGVDKGFIITRINESEVKDAKDAKRKLLESSSLILEGINLKGEKVRYGLK
ncbi:Do/DeqQ family serine protease [Tenacibaculum sediminilitoris]|uniref:trypsin-like peptidase domain-containing protein n=1 Tax=Tenacibaculum sediminilitoris TaxID=1820334 RepID=UPI0038934F43